MFYSRIFRRDFSRSISKTVKSYDDIPTRNSQTPIDPKYLHKHCDEQHKRLGSIYKDNLGSTELVFLSDTKLIQTVLANEGQYPHHNVPASWTFYNTLKKIERGIFFQTGEQWAKLRKVFNKVMLSDSNINKFTDDLMIINSDFFNLWNKTSTGKDWITIEDIKTELCKWSIEATGFMLFGVRMGCVPDSSSSYCDSRSMILVKNIANMFKETSNLQLLPVETYDSELDSWRRFEEANTNMIHLANEYAAENIERAESSKSSDSLVKDLLSYEVLSKDEISRSVIDLIIAAADTTSNSLQWMLFMLAKHQDVQNNILREVSPLIENSKHINNIKENAPYLRAFIKEVSRLYPTAPFLARTLDKSIVLNDYLIPKLKPLVFSLYTTSRMDSYFDEPLEFKPERWIRSGGGVISRCPKTTNHAYASLPFGIGARNCIGKRLAELEMSLLIASLVNRFECHLLEEDDIDVKLNMILCPSRPIRLKLRPR